MDRTTLKLVLLLLSPVLAECQGYSQRPHPFYSPQYNQERQNSFPTSPRLQQQTQPQRPQYQVNPQALQQYQFQPQIQQQYQIGPQRQQPYQIQPQRQQYELQPQRQQQYQFQPQRQQQYQIEPQRQQPYQIQSQRQPQYQIEPQRQPQYQIETQRQPQYQIEPQRQQQYQIQPQRQPQYQIEPQRQPQYQIEPQRQQQYQIEPQRQQQYQFQPQRQQQYQIDPQRQQPYQVQPQRQQYQVNPQTHQQYQVHPQAQLNQLPQSPQQYQNQNQMSSHPSLFLIQNQRPQHEDASSLMIESPDSPIAKQVLSTTNDMMQSVPSPHLKYDQNENPVLSFGSKKGFAKNLGDRAVQRGEFPYHVQIREHGDFICCGALVRSPITGRHVVLTATHCLVEKGTSIVGSPKHYEVRIDILDYEDFGQRRNVTQFLVHPGYVVSQYRSRPIFNDIGIMILEADFEENQYVQPVSLPPKAFGPTIWNFVTITGWGKGREAGNTGLSNLLRVVEIGVWESEDCDRIYYRESGQHVVTESQFCAGAIEGGLDSCQGDSGGPAITLDKGRPYLAGIVAWGKGCGQGQYPGLYTRVWSYKDWIKKTLYDYEINGIIPPPPKY